MISSYHRLLGAVAAILLMLLSAPLAPARAAGIWFVVPGGAGARTGADWGNASDLAPALAAAVAGEQIWAAAGTYTPTSGTDRSLSFALKSGVSVFGGFTGTETALEQRDWERNLTILSGEIGAPGASDNSYHVVTAIDVDGSAIALDGVTVRDGNADLLDSTLDQYGGGGLSIQGGSPALSHLIVRDNAARREGGGVYILNSAPFLSATTIVSNTSDDGGAGLSTRDSSPALSFVLFDSNVARIGPGGGMLSVGGAPTLTHVTFRANVANNGGGLSNGSDAILEDVVFDRNQALTGAGGGMYNTGSPVLKGVSFTGNSAAISGGGLYSRSGHPTLIGAFFTENYAGANAGGLRGGGGIFVDSGALTLSGGLLSKNTSADGGGIMCASGCAMNISGVTFDANMADSGGGLLVHQTDAVVVEGASFTNNSARYGGAVHTFDSQPQFSNTTFSGNHADGPGGSGGAIHAVGILYFWPNVNYRGPVLTNVTLSSNSATYGGAISTRDSSPTLTNVLISGNSATYGGALYNRTGMGVHGSNPTLTNVTIAGNSAADAAITNGVDATYTRGSSPTIRNSIIWDTRGGAVAIANQGSSVPMVSFSIVQGGLGAGTVDAGGNLDADPRFAEPVPELLPSAAGDLHLLPGSPAVNVGDNSAVSAPTDRDGNARIANGIVDLGAFEMPAFSKRQYLPLIVR